MLSVTDNSRGRAVIRPYIGSFRQIARQISQVFSLFATISLDAGIAAHPNGHIAPAFLIEEQFGSVAIGPVEETGINDMADEHTIPPYAPDDGEASVGARAAETARTAAKGIGNAIKESRKPGMPLDILANATREAPLGALLAAFLLGVIVARR